MPEPRTVTVAEVWAELLAECLATLERGAVDESIRLSRRHRWKPLAIDIDGELALLPWRLVGSDPGRASGG